jgi:4-hydroxybenzoate polyprenyltransferase
LLVLQHFLSLIRFSHTLFALPFAVLAALMAWRLNALDAVAASELSGPRLLLKWQEPAGILLAMTTARSAAMAFNRLVDRDLDAANPRTVTRHLPAGILTTRQVTWFAVASGLAFVASTLLFLPNRLPLVLSLPVLAFLAGYSYAKRFTSLAHFWLGAALGFTPLAAWLAIRGELVLDRPGDLLPPLVLGLAVWTWVAGFDIIYACQDADFDRGAGLHSLPARLGVARALRLAQACHLATVVVLALLPLVYPPLGWPYGLGVLAVGALLVYEHRLVRPDDLARVNQAFFQVNAVISLGLLAVGAIDLLW